MTHNTTLPDDYVHPAPSHGFLTASEYRAKLVAEKVPGLSASMREAFRTLLSDPESLALLNEGLGLFQECDGQARAEIPSARIQKITDNMFAMNCLHRVLMFARLQTSVNVLWLAAPAITMLMVATCRSYLGQVSYDFAQQPNLAGQECVEPYYQCHCPRLNELGL